jgi:hypothetical protein
LLDGLFEHLAGVFPSCLRHAAIEVMLPELVFLQPVADEGKIGAGRRVRRVALRFVLSRGPVGEIKRDASYQSDDQASGK